MPIPLLEQTQKKEKMKLAFYYNENTKQVIFTPESEYEKVVLELIKDAPQEIKWNWGSFYKCRGGWITEADHEKNSLMLTIESKEKNEKN